VKTSFLRMLKHRVGFARINMAKLPHRRFGTAHHTQLTLHCQEQSGLGTYGRRTATLAEGPRASHGQRKELRPKISLVLVLWELCFFTILRSGCVTYSRADPSKVSLRHNCPVASIFHIHGTADHFRDCTHDMSTTSFNKGGARVRPGLHLPGPRRIDGRRTKSD
jgi:hypothetical protein